MVYIHGAAVLCSGKNGILSRCATFLTTNKRSHYSIARKRPRLVVPSVYLMKNVRASCLDHTAMATMVTMVLRQFTERLTAFY